MKKIKLHKNHQIAIVIFIALALISYFAFFYKYERQAKAALTTLEITNLDIKVVQGSPQPVTITAYDGGTVFEDYGGKITFTSSDAGAGLPSDYTFKNGSKQKAISLNGWNQELKDHDYSAVTTKISDNGVSNVYLGVYETTGVSSGHFFCENDHSFAGVTTDSNYDLANFISSAASNGIDTYAWITIFGPEQKLNIDGDGRLENTWVDPESAEHLTFINNLVTHLLTNYAGLEGIVIDYIRYADPPSSNQNDGDNIDEAEYRVYKDGGAYSDHTGNFAPGNATTIVSNVVQSIANTVHGFANKEIAAETYSAHNDSVYSWIQSSLGQDYALFAPNIDFIVPLAYHIGWYEASWVAQVVDYVYDKVNPIDPSCKVWPKVQTWQEDKSITWPGALEIEDAVEDIDYAKVGGLGFYVYDHTSNDEWVVVKNCFNDNGTKNFDISVSFEQLGSFNLKVEDTSAGISDTQSNIEVFYGHPSGSIVTSNSTSRVYMIEDNSKRWISNPSVFNSRFSWNDIIWISNTELDEYSDGSTIYYPDGTLISNQNKAYAIEYQKKKWITSPSVFSGLGYKWNNILSVSDSIANSYNNGSDLDNTDSHPNGTIIAASGDPKVYILDGDRKRWIQNASIFARNYDWGHITWIPSDEKDDYVDGKDIGRYDGTLIHYSGKVYAIEYGKRRHILSPGAFSRLGYAWSNIATVGSSEFNIYDEGVEIVDDRFADYSTVIYGDSRYHYSVHQTIVNKIMQTDPEIVLHTGDLVNTGDSATDWNDFNAITSELRSKVPFYPSIGNHELPIDMYLDNFELPNNERWYSVEDNGVHYIVLDTTSDIGLGSEQYIWLEADLNGIGGDINFTVAIFHHPPFSTGSHAEDEKGLQTNVVPLFESKGVDIVFNGHDHNYERSLVNGIYYIVTGGGGAPLYSQTRSSDYSQKFLKTYHFCRVKIADDKLEIKAYDDDLKQIDEFEIGKNPPVAFYSDNQSDSDADDVRHQVVVDRILNTGANPIFHAGDLQEDGTVDSLNRFNNVTSTLRATRDFYAAIGNNDSNSSLYFDNFTFPGNERWYSVNTDNLHMVILDTTYTTTAPGSEQYNWLESDLQSEASQSRITGVMFHYPVYNNSGDQKGLINTIVPLFRDHGVDFVIAGHIHVYRKEVVDGIYYITNSGQTSIGYMVANVYNDQMQFTVYDSNNTAIDSITINE